jgi:phospholipid/cholesterol/gamma-HCH transport system substrate-binding protein
VTRPHAALVMRTVALLLAAVLVLAACDPQTATAPTGDLTLVAHFDDVQDLVRGHTVQVANVTIGSVRSVELDGHRALVTMSIVDDQDVPEGTTAIVRRTSFLGEFYIDLVFPDGGADGPFLASGDEITDTSTERDIEQLASQAEEVIRAVGADDVAGVIDAGAGAIGGNGGTINTAVDDAEVVLGVLADQSAQIGSTIDDLAALGSALAPRSDDIAVLIDELAAATAEVTGSRDRIIDAVEALVSLASTTTDVILVPHTDRLSQTLEELQPLLGTLTDRTEVLATLIVDFNRFTRVLPTAVHNGQLLLLAWAYLDASTLGLAPPATPPGQG